MATRMQQRRATAAQWTSANPVLAAGEIGFETDTNKFKIGNSVNAWDALDYFSTSVDLSGYATESYVDSENASQTATITAAYEAYADGATTDMATTTYVDDQDVATLAAANAYTDGEIAALVDSSPATLDTLNELAAALGDDANFATTVSNQIAGKADAVHTHAISDVTNLQTELDGKLSSSADYPAETTYGPFLFGGFYVLPTETTLGELDTYNGSFPPSGSISVGDEFRIITSSHRSVEIDNVVFIFQGNNSLGRRTAYLKDNADEQAVLDYQYAAYGGADEVDYIVTSSETANITEENLASLRNVTTALPNITISTSDPTGGIDGDVWLKYE